MKTRILIGLVVVLTIGLTAGYVLSNRPAIDKKKREDLKKISEAVKPLHRGMGKIRSGDWLASHQESGQSFDEYTRIDPNQLTKKRDRLYIQPIGDFNEHQQKMVDLTAEFMGIYFGCEVVVKKTKSTDDFPAKAKRVHPSWGMRQLLTTYILYDVLKPELPADAFAMIAFTSDDLWPEDGWNFVFGQASLRGRVGVWSIYRNGDPETDFVRCLERTLKTATHETGHMFSIQHCIAYRCNMNGSNNRSESDRHPLFLCPECLPKVLMSTRADAKKRFDALATFCKEHKLKEAAEYYAQAAEKVGE